MSHDDDERRERAEKDWKAKVAFLRSVNATGATFQEGGFYGCLMSITLGPDPASAPTPEASQHEDSAADDGAPKTTKPLRPVNRATGRLVPREPGDST